jgi:hypothetical protein
VPHLNTRSIFYLDPSHLSPLLGSELCDILIDLNYFTGFISYHRFRGKEFGDHESSVFESWNASLEYRLLSFDARADMSPSASNLVEALRIAAILWMSTGLWNFPLSTSLVCVNVQRLVDTLEECDLRYWCSIYPDLVLWMSVVGACCTPTPGPLRMDLSIRLEAVVIQTGMRHENDLAGALKRFIWMDGVYERQLSLLLKKVVRLYEEDTMRERFFLF